MVSTVLRFQIWFVMTFYYKMRQMLLQNATAILLKNATEVYYKMCQIFYYKMRQFFYKMQQLLQNATFVTNCNIADSTCIPRWNDGIFNLKYTWCVYRGSLLTFSNFIFVCFLFRISLLKWNSVHQNISTVKIVSGFCLVDENLVTKQNIRHF